jgi:hypothetical protein
VIGRLESGEEVVREHNESQPSKPPSKERENQAFWNSPASKPEAAADPPSTTTETQDAVEHLMTALQAESMRLYQNLQRATDVTEDGGKIVVRFPVSEKFHASEVQAADNWELLQRLASKAVGDKITIEVEIIGEEEDSSRNADPTADPKVAAFLKKFPGKVIVKKESRE